MTRNGLRLNPDYTEDVVGFALESYLTLLNFPRRRFSIEPFSRAKERWLGADARLHSAIRGFRPFYMQFKRPFAYPNGSRSNIIKDRRRLNLATAPHALFFPLRRKQPQQVDFQHNVLFKLRGKLRHWGIGDAAYVCPLFLNRSAYRHSLHWSGLLRWPRFWRRAPWDLEEVLLADGGRTIRFENIPILAEHVAIPPHATVTAAAHNYSFTEDGSDLCFHSPEALPDGMSSLASYLSTVAEGFLGSGDKIRPDQAAARLTEIVSFILGTKEGGPTWSVDFGDDPIGPWFAWGDHLSSNYKIEQYALVRWDDTALEMLF
jgi:hypothetical protein